MNALDYTMLFAYLLGVLAVAFAFSGKIKDSDDMFIAGGESPWWVSGLSAYMTMFSSGTFVVWGGIAYKWGLVGATICAGNGLAALFVGIFVAERWKRLGVTSAAAYFELRFGRNSVRFYTVVNLFSKLIAISVALYSVSVILCALIPLPEGAPFRDPVTGHLSVAWAVTGCGVLVVSYTIIGGLWAVLMTDVLQFFALSLCVLLVVPLCLSEVGGIGQFIEKAPDGFFSPVAAGFTWIFLAAWTVIQFASVGGEWAFAQRYLCVPRPKDAKKAALFFGALYIVSALIWMLPPMIYRVIDSSAPPEQAYILACQYVLPTGMIGLMIAAMFSATASMVDSQLNVFSGVLTRDFYARFFPSRSTEKHLITVGRVVVLALGAMMVAGAMAVPVFGGAQEVALSIAALVIGPLMLPTIWGLFSKRIGKRAIWLSVGLGFAVSGAIKFGFRENSWLLTAGDDASMVDWTRANLRAVETTAAVFVPALVLSIEELISRRVNEGWLALQAFTQSSKQRPQSEASELPAKVTAWSLTALSALMGIVCLMNESQQAVLLTLTLVPAAASAILFLTLRKQVSTS